MYARVASFNMDEGLDETIDQVRNDVEADKRPPGLEDAKGMMMLVDRSSGKSMGITLFDSEDADEAWRRGPECHVSHGRRRADGSGVLRGRRPDDGLAS